MTEEVIFIKEYFQLAAKLGHDLKNNIKYYGFS